VHLLLTRLAQLHQQPCNAPLPAAQHSINDEKEGAKTEGQPCQPPPASAPPAAPPEGSGFQGQPSFQKPASWSGQGPDDFPHAAPSSNMPTNAGVNPRYAGPGQYTGPATPPGMYGPGMQQLWTGQYPNQMGQQHWHPGVPQMGQPMMPMATGMMGPGYVPHEVQCRQQGHIITSQYGIIGILCAVLLFPFGIIFCRLDRKVQCETCHQIFHRGILD